MRNVIRPYLEKISPPLRKRRFEQFMDRLNIQLDDRILDVGGLPSIWHESGLEQQVTILNKRIPGTANPPFIWVEGDACNMAMFEDQSFDIVYSNSVIEHVGDLARQHQMAVQKLLSISAWICSGV